MSPAMNEAAVLRMLRGFRKVRGPDFHQPAMRNSKPSIENGGGVEKRHPLSKQERAEAEKLLSAGGVTRSTEEGAEEAASKAAVGADDVTAAFSSESGSRERAAGGELEGARPDVIDPANFFREFDAWVDSKYPGDRGSATKVKVAFRKQHRATVNSLCLEDIEDIAQAMQ